MNPTKYASKAVSAQEKLIVCLVIPTYNEKENIQILLRNIYSSAIECAKKHIELHTLIVDDTSPDGTAEIVVQMMKTNPLIHILVRDKKQGLGVAYRDGMRYAMVSINPRIIFEMDADHSHDPRYILPMVQRIRDGADVVIGSRYVTGGSTPADWGIMRNLMSKGANTYAKIFLPFKGIADCTGGFRAIRVSLLKQVDLELLPAKGYVFQIVLLHSLIDLGAKVVELPIHFSNRHRGESKVSISDITEILFNVPLIVLRHHHSIPGMKKVTVHG